MSISSVTQGITSQIKAARRVSTPLVAIMTADPAATMATVCAAVNGKDAPKIRWDIMTGLTSLNGDVGTNAIRALVDPSMIDSLQALSSNPSEALSLCCRLPARSIVFMLNAHRFLDNEAVAQAVWNLRDQYKETGRTLYLLAPQLTLPAELAQDVMVIDEELPGDEQLTTIAGEIHDAVGKPAPDDAQLAQLLPAMRGLSGFSAEQSLAMSLDKEGNVDIANLWERKRQQVEQTPGLQFFYGGDTMSGIGGQEQIKALMGGLFAGPRPPRLIVFIDEIEKSVGGSSGPVGDSSGVSQDQLGTMLRGYDELEAVGLLMVGPPGTGKSSIAKATGATYGIPTLAADFGAAKGPLVGQSEAQSRQMFKIIRAVGGVGSVLFLATSNRLESVPPELMRRLGRFGVWMVDLPTPAERRAIWQIAARKWSLDLSALSPDDMPDDAEWTGADITNCVELAYRTGMTPRAAADFLAPVAKSSPDAVRKIRTAAHNRFRSASAPGYYLMPGEAAAGSAAGAGNTSAAGRAIVLEG